MKDTKDYIQEFLEYRQNDTKARKIPTGFEKLDTLPKGGLPSGLIGLGAIPSLGKSTLILQMANNMASQENTKVLFFSLEMPALELLAKTFSSLSFQCDETSNLTSDDFMYEKDIKDLDTIIDLYEPITDNIQFVEGIYDIVNLNAKIKEYKENNTNDKIVVIIDYLQFIVGSNNSSDKQAVDNIVKALKDISKRLDLTIIVISSLNRNNYDNLTMEAFKESGSIEYTCDILLGLELTNGSNRTLELKQNPRKVTLTILKYRNCPMGSQVKFDFYTGYNTFFEK